MANEKSMFFGHDLLDDEIAKHTIKDSVFGNLFADKKYLLQLYQTLHPEDLDVTEDALTDITIHNILTDGIYNDLGFIVRGGRMVILLEVQSSWTENVLIRILIYLLYSYQNYLKRTRQNVYKSRKVQFPKPEMYMVYTGDRKAKPEYLDLSESFFDGQECQLNARVKVIYGEDKNDIINQYIAFTKVYDEQRKEYGNTRKAVLETIRICRDRNVLREYLENKREEVVAIMLAMLDEAEILRDYVEGEIYEAEQNGARKFAKKSALQMLKKGRISENEIGEYYPVLTEKDISELLDEAQQQAKSTKA